MKTALFSRFLKSMRSEPRLRPSQEKLPARSPSTPNLNSNRDSWLDENKYPLVKGSFSKPLESDSMEYRFLTANLPNPLRSHPPKKSLKLRTSAEPLPKLTSSEGNTPAINSPKTPKTPLDSYLLIHKLDNLSNPYKTN